MLATSSGQHLFRRGAQLLAGLVLFGVATAMMLRGSLGVSPWAVLAQGISKQVGLPFGLVTNVVGAVVLLCWIPIRQRPGIGTVLNVLLVGPSAEFGLAVISAPHAMWTRIALFAGGLVLTAIGTGLYIGAGAGPGPRDGLMTGIHRRTKWKLWIVRMGIDLAVLLVGWMLGGDFAVGTVAFALLIGPMVHLTIPWLSYRRHLRDGVDRGTGNAIERPIAQ